MRLETSVKFTRLVTALLAICPGGSTAAAASLPIPQVHPIRALPGSRLRVRCVRAPTYSTNTIQFREEPRHPIHIGKKAYSRDPDPLCGTGPPHASIMSTARCIPAEIGRSGGSGVPLAPNTKERSPRDRSPLGTLLH